MPKPRTLYDKIWDAHVVAADGDEAILYIDLHLMHEVTSPQAFEGLEAAGRTVRRPDRTLAVADHNVPTVGQILGVRGVKEAHSRQQLERFYRNVDTHRIPAFRMGGAGNGIVHVVGPEQGRSQPGMTIVCGDSHTSTHGAFGALAFGIGTSEVEHVLATQTLRQRKSRNCHVIVDGALSPHVTAKDLALHVVASLGVDGAVGHVIEFSGVAVRSLSMEGRMTLCNMAIEAGARAGLVAPDETTFDYVRTHVLDIDANALEQRIEGWRALPSDPGARFDMEVSIDAAGLAPIVSWGITPAQVVPVSARVPDPLDAGGEGERALIERALAYMGLEPGAVLAGTPIDRVFIGSCTNGRLEDLAAAADVVRGRKVAAGVSAMVVAGSGIVKLAAEAAGLDRIFVDAGFEWREPGCSMCTAMNGDSLKPGERCASTSNRNFENRQGRGGRTHLMSPAMAAAAAVTGAIVDVRTLN